MTAPQRPVVWSVGGSDGAAGAGLPADLRVFEPFDVHGRAALAAGDLPPQCIKTGWLASVEKLRCVVAWVDRLRRDHPVALVVDPVWHDGSGADRGDPALREVLLRELLPRASVITPNRAQAAWLLGWDAAALSQPAEVERAAAALRAGGPQAVVITGGGVFGQRSLDWLDTPEARGWLALPRVDAAHRHGSGGVFASCVAAALALGFCTADAAVIAKMGATQALRNAPLAGPEAGAVGPQRGFALSPDLLPSLHDSPDRLEPSFATLATRDLGLYAVVDSAQWVERVLAAGVRTVQLRIKEGTRAHLSREVSRSVQAARGMKAQLFVNDHWQLAIKHGAYGVHLGQEDLPTADMDALRRAGLRVGLSTHSYWEVCRAHAWAPSYIACGPIHATTTKEMPWWPQGPGNLAYWCRVLRQPVVAIAGMDIERSVQAMRCGAAGVAVLRGIVQAPDPRRAIHALQEAINGASRATRLPAPELPRSTYPGPLAPRR